jgi:hypothetical protein
LTLKNKFLIKNEFSKEHDVLFGHLVSRFSTHPENLATEAMAFILNRSATMREELRRLLGRTGIELAPLARFRSQAGDEQGNIPDLIGLDTMGAERLFIENKFWAGLTENQPAGYLGRLPAEGGGVLVFVVPTRRFPIVWNELAHSAMTAGTHLPDPEQLAGDLLFTRIAPTTALAVTTWRAVLDSLETVARASGETSSAADIAQLKSLCDVMDTEAFLPLRVEELTNLEVPQRLIGLANLIRDLSEQAVARGIADRRGLVPTHGWYTAGRYLKIGSFGAWLGIDHEKWSRYGITPLWVRFDNNEYGRSSVVLEALKSWASTQLFEQDGRAVIPLTILPNATRERVLEDLLAQLTQLHDTPQPRRSRHRRTCRSAHAFIHPPRPHSRRTALTATHRSCPPRPGRVGR